jgi:hypothetical protein
VRSAVACVVDVEKNCSCQELGKHFKSVATEDLLAGKGIYGKLFLFKMTTGWKSTRDRRRTPFKVIFVVGKNWESR